MTTSAAPKFSVVITNYNYANFIARAIDSVLSQDVEIELVVVDDCSKDNSREVIQSYGDRDHPGFPGAKCRDKEAVLMPGLNVRPAISSSSWTPTISCCLARRTGSWLIMIPTLPCTYIG
jgi:glycosyltransferase involved in cell wall biosynthesis